VLLPQTENRLASAGSVQWMLRGDVGKAPATHVQFVAQLTPPISHCSPPSTTPFEQTAVVVLIRLHGLPSKMAVVLRQTLPAGHWKNSGLPSAHCRYCVVMFSMQANPVKREQISLRLDINGGRQCAESGVVGWNPGTQVQLFGKQFAPASHCSPGVITPSPQFETAVPGATQSI